MNYIDTVQLEKLRKFMSEEKIHSLFQSFFDPQVSGKANLILAIQEGNHSDILTKVHYLKGAASFIGMQAIYEHCLLIEDQITNNPSLNLESLLNTFEQHWQESEAVVKKMMGNDAKPQ